MCSNMASSRQKRALESTNSSGEEGQRPSKRPDPITSNLQNYQINGSPGHFTLDDIRKVVREELREQANSDKMEPFDSRVQDALMGFIPQIRKLVGEENEQAILKLRELSESCVQNALKGIIPQIVSSLKNAFQERVCKGTDHPIPYSFKPDTSTLPNSTKITDTRNLKLRFSSKLSLPVYTHTPLKSERESPIQVELIDTNTDSVVTSGPESCAKLDVVVLRGDFDNEGNDTWSVKEFEGCMVNERKGKAPLLTGNLTVKLKEGKAKLEDLSFTDNSSWTSSKMFKIGVRVASAFCKGIRVCEATTEAFIVIHRRGEEEKERSFPNTYKKHYPPRFDDDIWRLDEIAKGGQYCKKLNGAGIYKVEHLMRILVGDPKKLQEILDGMPNKRWDALEAHAKTCVPDGINYEYFDDMKDFGVVISNTCQFQGFIDGGGYTPAELLPRHQEARAGDLVKAASMNWKHVKVFDPANYPCSKLGKSLPTSPIELFKEQHLCGSPSARHLTPLSVPKTQSSEIPWGNSLPMSDNTAGLGNGNHDHGVGINPQSSTQSHITNSTASVGSEQDTNRWNQQETSGPDNVQSTVPRESSAFRDDISWQEILSSIENQDTQNPFDNNFGTKSSFNPQTGRNFTEDPTIGFGDVDHNNGVGITPQSSILPNNTNLISITSEQDANPCNQRGNFGNKNVQCTEPHASFIPPQNTDHCSIIPEQDTNPGDQQETFGNENVQCTNPYEALLEKLMED